MHFNFLQINVRSRTKSQILLKADLNFKQTIENGLRNIKPAVMYNSNLQLQ